MSQNLNTKQMKGFNEKNLAINLFFFHKKFGYF